MKEAAHEKMNRDEIEYAERGGMAYAVCCSQHGLTDETELRAAFWVGFKRACAYLRAPGIGRAQVVYEAPPAPVCQFCGCDVGFGHTMCGPCSDIP